MPHHDGSPLAECLYYANQISNQTVNAVGSWIPVFGRPTITTEFDCHSVITRIRERWQLMSPGIRKFGKAMDQQHHGTFPLSHCVNPGAINIQPMLGGLGHG